MADLPVCWPTPASALVSELAPLTSTQIAHTESLWSKINQNLRIPEFSNTQSGVFVHISVGLVAA